MCVCICNMVKVVLGVPVEEGEVADEVEEAEEEGEGEEEEEEGGGGVVEEREKSFLFLL